MLSKTSVRFGILAGLFVAIILWASASLLQQKSDQIQLLQKELAGNELLQYLQQVRRNLGEYRLSHLDRKTGSQDDKLDQLSLATSELKSRLDRSPDIQSLSASSSPVYSSLDKILRIRDQKAQDRKEQDRKPELKQMSRHIQQLANSIGDASNLVLDSHFESYYVMSYLLTVSPKEQEYLVEVAASIQSSAGRQQALYNIDQLRSLIREHQRSLSVLLIQSKNSKLRAYLERSTTRYQELQDFTIQAEAALNNPSSELEKLVPASQKMLVDSYRAWNDGSIRLGELLVQRLNAAKQDLAQQAWLLFSTTALLLFFTGVVCFRLQGGIREAKAALLVLQETLSTRTHPSNPLDELDEITAEIKIAQDAAKSTIANIEAERDAAQIRTIEAETKASQAAAALDFAPVPIFVINASFEVIYLNEQAKMALPESSNAIVGSRISKVLPALPWGDLVGRAAELNSVPWEATSSTADLKSRVLPDGNTLFTLHLNPAPMVAASDGALSIRPESSSTPTALELLATVGQRHGQATFLGLLSLDNTLEIRRSMGDDAYGHGLESIAQDLRTACPDIFYCCVHAPGELLFAGLITERTQKKLANAKQMIQTPVMHRRQPLYLDISMGYSLEGALEEARMNLIQEQAKRFAGLDQARPA